MLTPAVPAGISACLFDLDGVRTQTAKVHAAAWKRMFDAFLLDRAHQSDEGFRPFELPADEGGVGWVVVVDRTGKGAALLAHGADVVAGDLGELLEER